MQSWTAHNLVVVLVIILGLGILAGMLLGHRPMPAIFGVDKSIRTICVALWTFLLPAWFSIDNYWAPPDTVQLAEFRKNQESARTFWTVVGGAAAIIIGATAPTMTQTPPANNSPPAGPAGTATASIASGKKEGEETQ